VKPLPRHWLEIPAAAQLGSIQMRDAFAEASTTFEHLAGCTRLPLAQSPLRGKRSTQ
jgi:hypothetical protein